MKNCDYSKYKETVAMKNNIRDIDIEERIDVSEEQAEMATSSDSDEHIQINAQKVKSRQTKVLGNTEEIKKNLNKIEPQNFIFLVIAALINSLGVGLLLVPNGIIDGGFSGLAILLDKFTVLTISFYLIVLNIPIYLFALKKLGKTFIVYSIFGIAFYSLFMFLIQEVFKWDGQDGNHSPITNVPLLAAIFGGLLSGVGSGLTIRSGGSLDGIEVLAVYFSKKVNISVGRLVMSYNVIMYLIAGFALGFDYPLYSIIAYAVGLKAVDGIVDGLDKAKAIMIITAKGNDVAKGISDIMGSGITMLKGQGYYSRGEKTVIYYVVNRFEIGKIKNIIKSIDDLAFVSITDVSEVVGKGVKKKTFNLYRTKKNKFEQQKVKKEYLKK